MDTRDGISLLSVKHHLMLFYLQSLVLLVARRAAGDTLQNRTPPSLPFSALDRGARGAGLGDLVDSMIEGRVVLEKIKVLESRIKYQIEKLVRIADDASKNVADGTSHRLTCVGVLTNAAARKTLWLSDPTLRTWSTMTNPRTGRRTRTRTKRQINATAYINLPNWLRCPIQKLPETNAPNDDPSPKRSLRSSTRTRRDPTPSLRLAWAQCQR